jgi:hypothetical protein
MVFSVIFALFLAILPQLLPLSVFSNYSGNAILTFSYSSLRLEPEPNSDF